MANLDIVVHYLHKLNPNFLYFKWGKLTQRGNKVKLQIYNHIESHWMVASIFILNFIFLSIVNLINMKKLIINSQKFIESCL